MTYDVVLTSIGGVFYSFSDYKHAEKFFRRALRLGHEGKFIVKQYSVR